MVFKMFNWLFGVRSHVSKAKPIEPLTQYLSENDTFKKSVVKFHNTKSNFWTSLDKMLEEELLPEKAKNRLEAKQDEKRDHTKF
jgi:hypothetical protein